MKRSILIADDEQAIRDSLLMILEEEGFQCTAVEDGQKALELVQKESFDLLVTDLVMPRMKGPELIHNLCKLHPGMPIIILTSYSNSHLATNLKVECNTTNLFKPVDFDELIWQIKYLLGQPSS